MIELKINGSKSPPLANRRLFSSGGEGGGPSTLCIEVENCVSGLNKLRLLSHRTTVSVLSHIGSKSPWPTTRISTRSLRKRPTNNPCCFHAVFSVLCHMRIIAIHWSETVTTLYRGPAPSTGGLALPGWLTPIPFMYDAD